MSRSRRKSPVLTDQQRYPRRTRWGKRNANKTVRRTNLASGGAYKKAYNSYNICDFIITNWNHDSWWGPLWKWYRK